MSLLRPIRRRKEGLSYPGNTFFWTKNVAVTPSGPSTPVTYTVPGTGAYALGMGSLPTGISLDADTGELSGTPTVEGYHNVFVIEVTGDDGHVRKTAIKTHVQVTPIIDYDTPQAWIAEEAITPVAVASTGGQVETYSQVGLPEGVDINATTGEITGTPVSDGSGSATITATGPTGLTDSFVIEWTVDPAP